MACAVVLAQQHPAAATTQRTTIAASVAAGLLCGSSEPPATAKDKRSNARQHAGADTFCGPVAPPLYPAAAKQQGIQGVVVLEAVIGADGTVRELRVIDGHPLLAPAAIEAVKRWKYKPYYVKGKPVEVETTITVNFRLEKQ
jgi:periplasmic protein TonB